MECRPMELQRALMDVAHEPLLVVDPDDSVILDANASLLGLLGHARRTFLGTRLSELLTETPDPTDWDQLIASCRARPGRIHSLEANLRRQDGRRVPVEIRFRLDVREGAESLVAAVRDLTEQRLREAAVATLGGHARRMSSVASAKDAYESTLESLAGLDGVSAVCLATCPAGQTNERHILHRGMDVALGALCLEPPGDTGEPGQPWLGSVEECRPDARGLLRAGGFTQVGWVSTEPCGDGVVRLMILSRGEPWPLAHRHILMSIAGSLGAALPRMRIEAEMRAQSSQLEHLAYHDPLTQLPNRTLLGDRIEQARARARRDGTWLAVCYLDLDGFKAVNDGLGHQAGDQLLVRVARCLSEAVRDEDTVARLGGDEFVLLLGALKGRDEVPTAVERALDKLRQALLELTLGTPVSASVGVAIYPEYEGDGEIDGDALLRRADQAMYVAKSAGRDRIHLFDPARHHGNSPRTSTFEGVRQALVNGELVLYYQPLVDLRNGAVRGVEALLRWRHPRRGLLLPADFLRVVAESDYAWVLDEWVIQEALDQIERWQHAGLELTVGVNLSARHLRRTNLVKRLEIFLAEHPNVPPARLALEIKECAAMDDVGATLAIVDGCKALGVGLTLDDFGSGFSSLANLERLRVGTLKVDPAFVAGIRARPEDRKLLDGIIALSRVFDLELVAKGLESEQLGEDALVAGFEVAQGNAIAAPMRAEEIPDWIRADHQPERWRQSASGEE